MSKFKKGDIVKDKKTGEITVIESISPSITPPIWCKNGSGYFHRNIKLHKEKTMKCQIINEDTETPTCYVNLADENSFESLSDFLDGIGDYRLEEIAE